MCFGTCIPELVPSKLTPLHEVNPQLIMCIASREMLVLLQKVLEVEAVLASQSHCHHSSKARTETVNAHLVTCDGPW